MKKILLLAILSSFLFGDIFNDLNEDKEVYFKYNNREYVIDRTCDIIDIKKLITIQDDLIKDKKSKKFYLDLCQPYKDIYILNKVVHSGKYNRLLLSSKYKKLTQYYEKSFYINFYAYLFAHRNKFEKDQNLKLFAFKNDDYSKYVNIFTGLQKISKYKKENYFKKVFDNYQYLLNSDENIIYVNIAKDISYYNKRNNKKDYEKFLLYRLSENDKRELSNKYIYMILAEYNFDKIYMSDSLDMSLVHKYILKSYAYGKDSSQVKLYMKIDVREHYLKLVASYPSYITSIAEFDLLNIEIENLKRYRKIVHPKYYYLSSLKSFIYERYLKLKYSPTMKEDLVKNYRFSLKKEKNINKKRRIEKKLSRLLKK